MHTPSSFRLAAVAAAAALAAAPAWAGPSSASSASSDSVSASIGSSSGSFEASSNASRADKTAAGEYRVVTVAEAPARAGMTRITLQALDRPGVDGEYQLYLPHAAAGASQVAPGQTVQVRARPFGLEFARGADGQAFFLVAGDDWLRGLQTRPVTL